MRGVDAADCVIIHVIDEHRTGILLQQSVVILETERGCCGGCAGDCRGSSCGGNGCKSKRFSLNLSTSTFMLKVYCLGVVGRRASYNQY